MVARPGARCRLRSVEELRHRRLHPATNPRQVAAVAALVTRAQHHLSVGDARAALVRFTSLAMHENASFTHLTREAPHDQHSPATFDSWLFANSHSHSPQHRPRQGTRSPNAVLQRRVRCECCCSNPCSAAHAPCRGVTSSMLTLSCRTWRWTEQRVSSFCSVFVNECAASCAIHWPPSCWDVYLETLTSDPRFDGTMVAWRSSNAPWECVRKPITHRYRSGDWTALQPLKSAYLMETVVRPNARGRPMLL